MFGSGEYTFFEMMLSGVMLTVYVYFASCIFVIAKKVNNANPWWAFVPILNLLQMVQMAAKPWYWFILLFIPLVNIVATIWIWVEIAIARGKHVAWGVLMVFPPISFVAAIVLASGQIKKISDYTYMEIEKTDFSTAGQR